jgi:antitoxin YxxD
MFESLKYYIGKDEGPIRFVSVKDKEVVEAETDLGFALPSMLKAFYSSIGYGWLSTEERRDLRNLVIHPLDIVDLFRGESEFSPPDAFLDGDLPIFDCGGDRFLVTRPHSGDPEKVYNDDGSGIAIALDVEDLVNKLIKNPGFYE